MMPSNMTRNLQKSTFVMKFLCAHRRISTELPIPKPETDPADTVDPNKVPDATPLSASTIATSLVVVGTALSMALL
jgi:hypothetical protein